MFVYPYGHLHIYFLIFIDHLGEEHHFVRDMKRRADASPHGDGNNNESSVISNVDLCGTTHRRHIRRSVSFRDDKILDEANLWKEKTSTEQCENRSSLSFIQVVMYLGVSVGFFDLI